MSKTKLGTVQMYVGSSDAWQIEMVWSLGMEIKDARGCRDGLRWREAKEMVGVRI